MGALVTALAGCTGDHDFLAQRSSDAAVPIDVADVADVRGEERRAVPPTDAMEEAPVDDRVDASEPPEPPGRWTFTLTNGLVDAASARFCLVPVVGGHELRDRAAALPPQALPFGKSLVLDALQGADLSTMGIHPYAVIGGGADADGGLGCGAILDAQDAAVTEDGAPRGPLAVSLPLIPAGTLTEGRSYLAVVTGCAMRWPYRDADGDAGTDVDDGASDAAEGGDASDERDATTDVIADSVDASPTDAGTVDVFRPPARAAICGASSGAPNAGLVLVRLSRRDVGQRIGFQTVHANTAVAGARVAVERPGGSAPVLSADVGPNQIVPRDGLIAVTRDDFGPTIGAATLSISSPVGAFPATAVSLASALAASDIAESTLNDGDLLTLVLIGAQPGQNPGPPWNTARFAIVRNAPLR
jgi:hypothetical protein